MPEWCASPLEGRLCCLKSCVKPFSWFLMTGPSFENARRLLPQGENGAMPSKGALPGLTLYPDSCLFY